MEQKTSRTLRRSLDNVGAAITVSAAENVREAMIYCTVLHNQYAYCIV
jgi:hypothetical protein